MKGERRQQPGEVVGGEASRDVGCRFGSGEKNKNVRAVTVGRRTCPGQTSGMWEAAGALCSHDTREEAAGSTDAGAHMYKQTSSFMVIFLFY